MRRTLVVAVTTLALAAVPGSTLAAPGDVFVADPNADGDPTFFAGVHRVPEDGGPAARVTAPGTLGSAHGIVLRDAATAFTVGFQTVDRVDLTTGTITSVADGAPFGSLSAVAFDELGSLVATTNLTEGDLQAQLLRIDPDDGSSSVVTSGGSLVAPDGLAVDREGQIYVADPAGAEPGKIVRVDPLSGAQTVVSAGGLRDPYDLAFLPDGDLLVIDESYGQYRGALVRIDPSTGAQEPTYFDGDLLGGDIGRPVGLALDDLGRAIVALRESSNIERIDLATRQVTMLANDGLVAPAHIALAPSTTGPSTVVTTRPPAASDDATPTVAFTTTRYDASTSCAVDGGVPVDCTSPFTTPALGAGTHTISLRSRHFGVEGPATTVRVRVEPVLPVNTTRPLVTGTQLAGGTLTTDDGSWGNAPTSFDVAWRRCPTTGSCTEIGSADATDGDHTYTVTAADEGFRLVSAVTAVNASGSVTVRSVLDRVAGLPERITRPAIDRGEFAVDEVVTTDDGDWNGAPDAFAVRWEACDELGCSALTSPDALDGDHTFTVTDAELGSRLRSRVTATNAVGSRYSVSRKSQFIGRPTSVFAPRVTPSAPSVGSTVTVSDGTWNGTPFTFGRRWVRCDTDGRDCVPITTADALDGDATYGVTAADAGRRIRGAVTARNVYGDTPVVSPATAVVP